jgi:hypothetical protein
VKRTTYGRKDEARREEGKEKKRNRLSFPLTTGDTPDLPPPTHPSAVNKNSVEYRETLKTSKNGTYRFEGSDEGSKGMTHGVK